jgi:hypothetical protein
MFLMFSFSVTSGSFPLALFACEKVQVERRSERAFSRGKLPLVGEKGGDFFSNVLLVGDGRAK